MVSGTCVTLIGAGLIGSGIKYWGGGVFCAENDAWIKDKWASLLNICKSTLCPP